MNQNILKRLYRSDRDMCIKVSVIIPVFNAQQYIEYCLQSLTSQTLVEAEFIFVNDGSVDDSQSIIEDYQKKDSRIKLVNQHNQGVSTARNNGLKVAKGKYIGFVDADDTVKNDMFETLFHHAEMNQCDVVISNYVRQIDGRQYTASFPFPEQVVLDENKIKQHIFDYLLMHDDLNAVWNKLYLRSTIEEYGVLFPHDLALGEDQLFNWHFFSYAKKCVYTQYAGYYYRDVEGSATRSIAHHDYFARAIDVYLAELPTVIQNSKHKHKIQTFKTTKLIKQVMSYIHLYLAPSQELSLRKRAKYVKHMLTNQHVISSISNYHSLYRRRLGRYEKVILWLMKHRMIVGLYVVTSYSRYRNK